MSSLPVKADDTRLLNRETVVGALAGVDCQVRNGKMTEEEGKELMNIYFNPDLKDAYSWALSSDKASKAVQAVTPYVKSDCKTTTISDDEVQQLLRPYLK